MSKLLSYLFIPQKRNNYRAVLAQPGFMALLLAFYLFNQSIIKSISIANPGVLGFSSEITINKVLYLTNQERQKKGLPELKLNSSLSKSAQSKADHMFTNNYWAHNAPDGTNPWYFFKQQNYQYLVAGENLAKDFYDTESMVNAWMKSPTHRDNILHQKYEEIGIGVVNGRLNGVETTLVVQHFGDPIVSVAGEATISLNNNKADLPDSQVAEVWGAETQSLQQSKPLINPLSVSKLIGGLIFGFMIVVLFIDGLITLRDKNHRLTSSVTGQVGFLAIIFVLLMIAKQGAIF